MERNLIYFVQSILKLKKKFVYKNIRLRVIPGSIEFVSYLIDDYSYVNFFIYFFHSRIENNLILLNSTLTHPLLKI